MGAMARPGADSKGLEGALPELDPWPAAWLPPPPRTTAIAWGLAACIPSIAKGEKVSRRREAGSQELPRPCGQGPGSKQPHSEPPTRRPTERPRDGDTAPRSMSMGQEHRDIGQRLTQNHNDGLPHMWRVTKGVHADEGCLLISE